MTQQTNNQTIHQFVAGQLYDGSEVIAFLHAEKPKKKRAPSAYNCFIASTEQREAIKAEQPEITPKEMMGALAGKWKLLSEDEKQAFKPAPVLVAATSTLKSKRAPSAYNCFIASTEQRLLIKEANPDITPKEMMGALAGKWKLLTDEEKAVYKPTVPPPCSPPPALAEKKKRAPSAYNRFIADKERRTAIKLANPDAAPKDIMSLMAAVWKTLSEDDKAAYQ
jgi:hypothetical protein